MAEHNLQERVIPIAGTTAGLSSVVAPMFAQAGWSVAASAVYYRS